MGPYLSNVAGDVAVGHERRQVGAGQDLDVQVGERDDRFDVVLGDQPLQERHVVGVVDTWRRHAEVGRVLRGGERRRVGRDRERVLGERADDVVALADTSEDDGYSTGFHPPVSPL